MITDNKDSKAWLERMYKGFESSSGKTPEFVAFTKMVKRWFETFVRETGCQHLKFSIGHFYLSGFFTAPDGKIRYFNTGDVRNLLGDSMLLRTADSYDDFRGFQNQEVPYDFDNFVEIFKKKIGV